MTQAPERQRVQWCAAIVLAAFANIAVTATVDAGDVTAPVKISSGMVAGSDLGDVVAFKGIPYAAPPVGPLRWRAPQAPADWDSVFDATEFGPRCVQDETPERAALNADRPMSEDCLTLNIFAPKIDAERQPVLVWIHGGALETGSSSEAIFDGISFAQRPRNDRNP